MTAVKAGDVDSLIRRGVKFDGVVCALPLTNVTLPASTLASLAYVGNRLRTTEPGVSAMVLPSRSLGEATP